MFKGKPKLFSLNGIICLGVEMHCNTMPFWYCFFYFWQSVLFTFQTLTCSVTLKMGCATGSRMYRMTLTGSGYRVQLPQLIQAPWRTTPPAQPEDTTFTWNPLSHANSEIKQFCSVPCSTLLAMEPVLSVFIITCLGKKFIACQSSKEVWVTLMDGCCGTSLEIKKTDGSERHSPSEVLSHFRYYPSKLWSIYLLHLKTLRVYKSLHNIKAICNWSILLQNIFVGVFEEKCEILLFLWLH